MHSGYFSSTNANRERFDVFRAHQNLQRPTLCSKKCEFVHTDISLQNYNTRSYRYENYNIWNS